MNEDYSYGDMDVPKQQINYEPMFGSFFAWVGVVFAGLITAAICWQTAAVVGMKSDIAVLLARPEGISRAEYLRDTQRTERDMADLRERMRK
jgi:hypothetical protein